MSKNLSALWADVLDAGLVEGDVPTQTEIASPWYVKALLGFSGWLAAGFLLGFFGMALDGLFDSAGAAFLLGAVLIGIAFALLSRETGDFLEHLSIASSLAGQVLFIVGFINITNEHAAWACFLTGVMQLALLLVMPNYIHRVLCGLFAAIAFWALLGELKEPHIFGGLALACAAVLWLHEFKIPKYMKIRQAAGYGLVLALVVLKGVLLAGGMRIGHTSTATIAPWVGEILTGGVAFYVVWHMLRESGRDLSDKMGRLAIVGTVLFCAASFQAPGISTGLVILLLGFHGANRVLMGLGAASLLYYISAYYYLLDTTLLVKSGTLLAVGAVLLGCWWILQRILKNGTENDHA